MPDPQRCQQMGELLQEGGFCPQMEGEHCQVWWAPGVMPTLTALPPAVNSILVFLWGTGLLH